MLLILLYIFSFLLVDYVSRHQKGGGGRQVKLQVVMCFLLLFVFFGFRDLSVLNDTHHYCNGQMILLQDSTAMNAPFYWYDPNSRYGAGFQIFSHVIAIAIPIPYGLIVVSALLFTIGSVWFYRQFTDRVALCVFYMLGLMLLFGQYSALRQSLAIVCFYVAMYCNAKEKHVFGLLAVYVATLFHASADVMYVFYAITFLKPGMRNIERVLAASAVLTLFLVPFMGVIGYEDNHYVTDMGERSTVVWSAILISIMNGVVLFLCMQLQRRYHISPPHRIVVWGTIIGFFFSLSTIVIIAFDRLALYTAVFEVMYFIHYIERCPKRTRQPITVTAAFVVLMRATLELALRNEWKHLIPYSFYDFASYTNYIDLGY